MANISATGRPQLLYLRFTKLSVLRRLTLRIAFPHMFTFERTLLLRALSTIVSPNFCEFALELCKLPPHFKRPSSELWGSWGKIDEFLVGRFSEREGFKVVIRLDNLDDWETFRRHARKSFPLLARKGCIYFET